jgi:hypothetical protein
MGASPDVFMAQKNYKTKWYLCQKNYKAKISYNLEGREYMTTGCAGDKAKLELERTYHLLN